MASLAELQTKEDLEQARRAERRDVNLGTKLEGTAEAGDTTVRNVSATGLLIHSSVPIAVGESLHVDLPQGGVTEATVVWADGNLHGCEFGRPISAGTVSAAILKSLPVQPAMRSADAISSESFTSPGLSSRAKLLIIVSLAMVCWLPLLWLVGVLT